MIKSIFCLFLLLASTTTDENEKNKHHQVKKYIYKKSAKEKLLGVKTLDHNLLNKIVFQLVNKKRQKKGLDSLKFSLELSKISLNFQDKLELRRFTNTSSIERKINRTLYSKTKNGGFDGGLVIPVIAESEALDYNGKSDFFYNKISKNSEFKLFYGKKPRKSELNPSRVEIKALNYYSFAKKLLKKIESENKKELYSKAYKWGGLHLQWYYKSLNKRKIPQIKMIFILGGFATAGMR